MKKSLPYSDADKKSPEVIYFWNDMGKCSGILRRKPPFVSINLLNRTNNIPPEIIPIARG